MATADPNQSSRLQALRNSVVAKVGGLFGLLALLYTVFLIVTTSLTGQLIGVSAALDQAGTERMRVYKIGLLMLTLDPATPSPQIRQAILHERGQWEAVLEELRSGPLRHSPLGIMNPRLLQQIQDLRTRWDHELRPTIDAALGSSGRDLENAQQQYLARADGFVGNVSLIVHTLEQHAATRTEMLYVLQVLFLVLSISLMGFAVFVLHRRVHEPLGQLTRRVQRLVAGNLDEVTFPSQSDEVGRLASSFDRVADNLRDNVQELEALHATGQEITSLGTGGLDNVLRRIVDRAADLIRTDLAILLVRHPMMDCWVVEAASGQAFDTLRHQILLLEETPFANQTFESKQPVLIEDLSVHKDKTVRFRDEFGAKSYLGVPLLGPHDSIGILGLWNTHTTRRFSDRDVRTAQQFAAYASVAIENARLFDEVESESRQLRDKLKSVERTIAELTHEVKAPAGRVAEFASWIEEDNRGRLDEKALRYLHWIKKEGADLAHLADRTLNVARLMQTSAPIESVDAYAVVQEVTQLLAGECMNKGIRLQVASRFPRLACRRIHLRQILENLVGNAIKYIGSQAAPRIEIGWEEQDTDVVLFVHDNGMGIDQAMTEEIFIPFQRLVGDEISGAGIGLSVVKTIVELYGGRVWVKSQLGVGSTFYVQLPTVMRSSQSQESESASLTPTDGSGGPLRETRA